MLRVIRNHRRAAYGRDRDRLRSSAGTKDLEIPPVPIIDAPCFGIVEQDRHRQRAECSAPPAREPLGRRAQRSAKEHGYRNAQVTVIAPTGTIGLLMDCDTTGVEPDFALVKFKKLAGGGYFKIANQSLRPALRTRSATATTRSAEIDDSTSPGHAAARRAHARRQRHAAR